MGIFKKSLKYSKPSKDLDYKIKKLDENLKQTGVNFSENDSDFVCLKEDKQEKEVLPEIYDKLIEEKQELELYNWRNSFLQEDNNEIIVENAKYQNQADSNLERVQTYISESNKELIQIRDQIFSEISENTLLNLPEIKDKISRILDVYDRIEEGLLNEPPQTKNEDPLTPLNQNFITADDLNKHYSLFINRVQEQLATIGGGGEYRLKYLDDIVGIATNASTYDGKFLSYNHNLEKFEFVGAATTSQTGIGISIGDTPPVDTTRYPLWYDNQTGRSYIYYTDEDGSQWVDLSPSTTFNNKTSYWVQTGVGIHTLSNVGVGTTNPSTKFEVQNGDIKVGIDTSSGVILTSPNGSQYRLIVDNSGNLSTVFIS